MKILEKVKVKDGWKWWYQWVVEGNGDEGKDDENFDDDLEEGVGEDDDDIGDDDDDDYDHGGD